MSSIGLNTNTFRLTSKYLDLLNNFIVKTKVNDVIEEGAKDHVVDFIKQLKDENNPQPQFQLLSNILERELRGAYNKNFESYMKSVIDELEANDSENFLPKIELLTEILDTENSEALSKIIGE